VLSVQQFLSPEVFSLALCLVHAFLLSLFTSFAVYFPLFFSVSLFLFLLFLSPLSFLLSMFRFPSQLSFVPLVTTSLFPYNYTRTLPPSGLVSKQTRQVEEASSSAAAAGRLEDAVPRTGRPAAASG
jgi:hypothetical protein